MKEGSRAKPRTVSSSTKAPVKAAVKAAVKASVRGPVKSTDGQSKGNASPSRGKAVAETHAKAKAKSKVTRTDAALPAKDEVSALARGLALLKVVGDAAGPLGNRELADLTGIPKATVSRLAATLVAGGYLRQSLDTERFTLGPALLDMGTRYLRHFDLREVARPHLAALADFAGASVHLGVRDELDVLIIDSMRPRGALITSRIEVGARMTLATSAAGRAYLASLPDDEQAALIEEMKQATGENWAALAPRVQAALAEWRQQGFCTSFGEWHPHIHALGFALRGPRGERYAVSCGGPAYLLPREQLLTRVAPKLVETLRRIEADAGVG